MLFPSSARTSNLGDHNLLICNQQIVQVNTGGVMSTKYRGVFIDSKLKWYVHLDYSPQEVHYVLVFFL